MIYNFINCDKQILKSIVEIQKILKFSISNDVIQDGIPVEIEESKDMLSVNKTSEGIKIKYHSLNTLFRGIFLMIANEDKEEIHIEQKCSFKNLGIMLDASRNAVMKIDTIKDMVCHLALLGYNSLKIYTEDTMQIENEEYFGYMRGAYTTDEIKEVDSYCKMFGIELIPCIQTLAHINQITRYERYDNIIDNTDILLVGEEKTYELLESIIKTAATNYSSRKINIGMDEAHMVGLGKYLDKYGYSERYDIMIAHLERVIKICEKYGLEPQMWSDMFFRLVSGDYYSVDIDEQKKELFSKIPRNVKLIYWDYYAVNYDHYNKNIEIHKSITDNVGFAGGAWKWTGFAPDNAYSILTGENSIKACKDNNISDFLLTCWGDNGGEASVYSILPSIYFYAENAYSEVFTKEYFKTLTGIEFDDYMKVDLPNRLVLSDYERNNASKYFLYNDILIGTFDSLIFDGIDKIYGNHAKELKEISEKSNKYGYIFKTLEMLCSVLELKANLGVTLKKAYDLHNVEELIHIKDMVLPELNHRLKEFYNCYFEQWHHDNKSFGFEVQCIRLGGLSARVDYVIKRIGQFLDNSITKIEELEIDRKPFSYFETKDLDKLIYNLWNVIVTPSVM
jgi:hexosaminidase